MIRSLIVFFISLNSFAQGIATGNDTDGYQMALHDYEKINLHSEPCRFVHKNVASLGDNYVATKTQAEWSSFITNPPAGVLSSPCNGTTGNSYTGSFTHSSGQKFYMSEHFQSCTETCSDHGGCVAAGFADFTNEVVCQTIIEGIIGSAPAYTDAANTSVDYSTDPDTNPNSASTALGCTFYESTGLKVEGVQGRLFATATCDAMTTTEGYMRVCPCAN
jgi:hypothetical protein